MALSELDSINPEDGLRLLKYLNWAEKGKEVR
jgi:hypothetical protein